jgi:predicted nucleic acid-binding protein
VIAYFDTSALVKLFLDEPGRDLVERFWEAFGTNVTSVAAYPEARSGLAGAARDGRLRPRRRVRAVEGLGSLLEEMSLVELGIDLAREAGHLAERYALRGYDAVHLATALSIDDEATTVLTWDVDLANAAADVGLSVAPG